MKRTKKACTVAEVQALDRWAIETCGIPSVVLMENAGRRVAEVIAGDRILNSKSRIKHPVPVIIVCGTGNNGGDGFVVARYLLNAGVKVETYLVGQAAKLKKDAALQYLILKKLKHPIQEIQSVTAGFKKDLMRADVVVDAFFGVGLNRALEAPQKNIIEAMNASGRYVVAVDIPSGLDGTTGESYGACVCADLTVTFHCLKKGFLKKQGLRCCGKVVVVDIGIPRQ